MIADIALGHDHFYHFTSWAPDRELNPQYDGIPDVERFGLIIIHPSKSNPAGPPCVGGITFDGEVQRRLNMPDRALWQVESWEPLTISPSLLCFCGDHGWIRNGRWEPC